MRFFQSIEAPTPPISAEAGTKHGYLPSLVIYDELAQSKNRELYDVLTKRDTPSWNDKTREVIDARLSVEARPEALSPEAWQALEALCQRIMPQPGGHAAPNRHQRRYIFSRHPGE